MIVVLNMHLVNLPRKGLLKLSVFSQESVLPRKSSGWDSPIEGPQSKNGDQLYQ